MKHFLRLDEIRRAELDQILELADVYDAGSGPTFAVFPPETLDKPEAHEDVAGYLADFVDVAVARAEMPVLHGLAAKNHLPIVNAMTGDNHPCEVLSDVWALRKLGRDFTKLRYAIVGVSDSNVVQA